MAKQVAAGDVPAEYFEIDDIIDRKVDDKSHTFLYKVSFKGDDNSVWIPGHNFLDTVKFKRRKTEKSLISSPQFAIKSVGESSNTKCRKRKGEKNAKTSAHPPKISKKSIESLLKFHPTPKVEYEIHPSLAGNLKSSDIADIYNGKWLSDTHVYSASFLFKKKYPNLMQLNLHRSKKNVVASDRVIQIHHDNSNHWFLSCNMTGEVLVYDSIYDCQYNDHVKEVLKSFYKDCVRDNYSFEYAIVQKQKGSSDCGLFAIAFALDLAEGNDPTGIEYNQKEMRNHLVQCFQKGELKLFPRLSCILN